MYPFWVFETHLKVRVREESEPAASKRISLQVSSS